jgi:hypothetical protein
VWAVGEDCVPNTRLFSNGVTPEGMVQKDPHHLGLQTDLMLDLEKVCF